ncbi:MAG TPA: phosphotransferase [Acidimicrobiales bacterium]|nr:phosphotransferase [Acidimicrobiales bacterium]
MLRSTPPPPGVCADFGVLDRPLALAGGQGGSWRVGRLVLKKVGTDPVTAEELRWLGTAVASTPDVRVASPVPASDGSWVLGGWSATTFLEGEPAGWRWAEVLDAGRAFSASVARLPRPSFLDRRRSPWDTGDRMSWGDEALTVRTPGLRPLIDESAAALRPVDEPSQLVHGDLGGNVLLADGAPPAVIDLSPYWRPVGWSLAVVAVDALVWSDADPDDPAFAELDPQMLLRAMLYRLVTDDVLGRDTSAVNEPVLRRLLLRDSSTT